MTEKRDYYEVLVVERNASSEDIRKAYRQAALKYHPDRNPDDPDAESKFKEATEAYSVLSDPEKRQRYDQFGHAGLGSMGGMDFGGADIFSHFQDLFADFFGGFAGGGQRRQRNGPQQGDDLRVVQRITLREAVTGCKREVSVRAPVTCDACEGTGSSDGSSRKTCATCHGTGQVSNARGFVVFATTCPNCRGQGSVITKPCKTCHGAGQVEKTRKVLVTFPAGIDSGQRMRVSHQGGAGVRGGPPGDLYVDVNVEDDENFERDGFDLFTRARISFSEAALGTSKDIALLDDTQLTVDIPAGTQPGEVITVRDKGVPRINGREKGSLHVVVQVDVPKRVSSKAKALLQQLDELLANETQSNETSDTRDPIDTKAHEAHT